MKKRTFALALALMLGLSLLLAGCQSAPKAPEETNPVYAFLPQEGDASIEEMVRASIQKIQEVTGREDEPIGFETTHSRAMAGIVNSSGNWNIRLIYPGGDVYTVNMVSMTCEIVNIILMPEGYYEDFNAFYQAGIQANEEAELIYSKDAE